MKTGFGQNYFSEDTFLFTNTGAKIATNSIGCQANDAVKEEKLNEFQEIAETILRDKNLSYSDFVTKYCKMSKKSEPTAKRVISKMLQLDIVEKFEGIYRLPIEALEPEGNQEI